ncbi:MAG TPA: hypothetical protein VE981_02025 [Planctomycetota bacterium]|nr:hypothetical protein [Planctomycetota bacterium]
MRTLWIFGSLLLALGVGAATPQDKAPVPDATSQQKAEKEVRGVYTKEFAQKDREGKKSLGQKLLAEAAGTKEPASRYTLLSMSRDLATDSLDFGTAFAAIDRLYEGFELVKAPLTGATFSTNLYALKAVLLGKFKSMTLAPEDSYALLDAYLKLAQGALAGRQLDDAVTWADLAAKNLKDPPLIAKAADLAKELRDTKKEDEEFPKAEAQLAAKPDDPEANAFLGRYYFFVRGEAEKGIAMLAKAADPLVKDAARREASNPAELDAQVELGDVWWSLAKKEKSLLVKRRYEGRARFWLDKVFAAGTGLVRSKAEKRIDEIEESHASGPIVDLLQLIDPKKDGGSGSWEKTGAGLSSPKPVAPASLSIPYVPPQEFDLKLTLEKRDIHVLHVLLAAADLSFILDNQSTSSSIRVGSRDVVACGSVIPKDKTTRVVCSVRLTGVTILVDGKPVLEWKGNYVRGSQESPSKEGPPKVMSLNTWGSWYITKMTLIPLFGQGKKLR